MTDKNLVRLETKALGRRTNKATFMHWHEEAEFLLVRWGRISVNVCGEVRDYSSGDIAVINSGLLHSISVSGSDCEFYCLSVSPALCDLGVLPTRASAPVTVRAYEAIVREFDDRRLNFEELVEGMVKTFMVHLSREGDDEKGRETDKKKFEAVKKTVIYMYANFDKKLTLDKIAEGVGLNKFYLCHLFSEVTGRTLYEHLNFIRCQNAKGRILSGESVSASAIVSGFNNISYFSRVYKRLMGNLPAEDKRL